MFSLSITILLVINKSKADSNLIEDNNVVNSAPSSMNDALLNSSNSYKSNNVFNNSNTYGEKIEIDPNAINNRLPNREEKIGEAVIIEN